MQSRQLRYALVLASLGATVVVFAQGNRYPMLDMLSQKVIQKYQTSTCQQLAANKAAPPNDMERRAVELLRQDPQLRAQFLDKVAAPIANKLFECGLIP